MTDDTTDASYWLNWRFLLCAIWVLVDILVAGFLIWKYEGRGRRNRSLLSEQTYHHPSSEGPGVLYKDEAWMTCVKQIHPLWLMGFRVSAFVLMLTLIVGNTVVDSPGIFIYYTQWTFSLVTIYFGLASVYSVYGCLQFRKGTDYKCTSSSSIHDTEGGTYVTPLLGETEGPSLHSKSSEDNNNVSIHQHHGRPVAGFYGYLLQIMYQVCAGAVVLTDVVFWLVIFPFLTSVDFELTFYEISMHTVNIVLLGDTMLNGMRFPMFRFAYFVLWTALYVVFQWISHGCVSYTWPYPFLDLSTPFAPIWYVAVGVLHIPCYGVVALIVKLKHLWMSRSFPDSYQGMR